MTSGASSASRRIGLTYLFEMFLGVADRADRGVDAPIEQLLLPPRQRERLQQRADAGAA
jgi:hypothetical protein